MTDYDIVMALEDAEYKVNGVVTQGFYLSVETFNAVVDLINRQKAEIEILQAEYTRACAERDARVCTADFFRAEAIKEFAEKLKAEAYNECDELMASIIVKLIDNCLKGVEGE